MENFLIYDFGYSYAKKRKMSSTKFGQNLVQANYISNLWLLSWSIIVLTNY